MCLLLFFLVACSMMIQLQCASLDCHMHFVCLRSYGSSPKHQRAIMAAILPVEELSDDEPYTGPDVWKEFDKRLYALFCRTAGRRPGFYFFFTDLAEAEQRHLIRRFADANGSKRRIAKFWHELDQLAAATASRVEHIIHCSQHAAQRSRSRSRGAGRSGDQRSDRQPSSLRV